MVVPVDVVVKLGDEPPSVGEVLAVEHLFFQMTEEVSITELSRQLPLRDIDWAMLALLRSSCQLACWYADPWAGCIIGVSPRVSVSIASISDSLVKETRGDSETE
jgi:hypothetical protein